jgi:hypothetical protein
MLHSVTVPADIQPDMKLVVDPGFMVDLGHDGPPDQPPSPDQPR